MRHGWLALLLTFMPMLAVAGETPYACNMRALGKAERARHEALSKQLFARVAEQRELADGYALRLPHDRLVPAAQWAELERKCCPFLTFTIESERDGGAVWLRITAAPDAKAFMKEELGL
ncbi:MAG: hypothetical protein ABL977_00245 [Candidatus Eisenbacteria bacterium]